MTTSDTLLGDLAPFVDLGTEPPRIAEDDGRRTIRFYREGKELTLHIDETGASRELSEEGERRHASVRALLASPSFANLGRWADSQRVLLKSKVESERLPVEGRSNDGRQGGLEIIDDLLGDGRADSPRNTILLIDGPAGIGKTSVIRKLALRRADLYRSAQKPLVLHVESRGRVLQNLTDLMAFSLQTLRVPVTYDQIPPLVRNGLVSLAIDGFDELGDPNGYELAWAQLNELIVSTRGRASILLSGRETFISLPRIEKALTGVDPSVDILSTFTIALVKPIVAKEWLASKGWSERALTSEAAVPLFEEGSYALRPFFLGQLGDREVAAQVEGGTVGNLLPFLVSTMVRREAGKFGREVESVTTVEQRETFIIQLMEEVARDLAENQTDAVASETLVWFAEAVCSELIPSEVVWVLKNRLGVIDFLTDDLRRGYKRFIHEQLQNFFLLQVTIKTIIKGQIPKFLTRSILGADFLESFTEVARITDIGETGRFVETSLRNIDTLANND